ncbi:hypothetical protein [Actinoallomurus iriomotensis]|uniref:Uncharacterized protein n=1 Tax=Actinoallomurus iriomotensis TaxID=478107 RepID=A0A9W6S9R0_9ACTN|nr:hypothetical protein [Actinoallomurus iriomotensis]GLY88315.1 hypothetical protein Airi02_062440 [Actinoallomurus iriomotensis]
MIAPIFALLAAAGPRFDPVVTKDRVRFLVAVAGADGPQLAVPGDLSGGRYVARVTSIWAGVGCVRIRAPHQG